MRPDLISQPRRAFETTLSDADRDVVLQAAKKVSVYDPRTDTELFVAEAQIQAAALPESLRRALLRFRRHGHPAGGLLIRGLPTGDVPRTPEHADDATGAGLLGAAVMSLVAAVLGDQYGFKPELGGNIVQDVLPVRGFEHTQQSISSKKRLFDHVEMAFTDNRADYVGLFCLRADHDGVAATTLSPIDAIVARLEPATIAALMEPRYKTTVDGSFLRGAGIERAIWIGPISVLSGNVERLRVRADFAETRGMDPAAQAALDTLREVAADASSPTKLTAGDLVFIDNHRAFHGRTAFTARWDGFDRWLLRTFVTKDLARSAVDRPADGRIVDADYSIGPSVLLDAT